MGTDIHCFVQTREDGEWKASDWPELPTDRNYGFFGILANVRNGTGFAGVITGKPYVPITSQRGFPEGFDYEQYKIYSKTYLGYHDFGWVTLKELKDYDASGTETIFGMALKEAADRANESNALPDEYCAFVGGPGADNYASFEVTRPITEGHAYAMLDEWIQKLETLDLPDEDVRVIFGFDS